MVKKEIKYYVCGFEMPKGFYNSYKVPKIEVCNENGDDSLDEKFEHNFVETTSQAKISL